MKISDLKLNPANPRIIKDHKFRKLVDSISKFPKMMKLRPIIIASDGTILGGNMRFKALQELKYKEIPDEWVKRADEFTAAEVQEFIIKDNIGFGEWDMDMLANEWDAEDLVKWGLDLPVDFNASGEDDKVEQAHLFLKDKFVVPPFSILDTRQGYWQERKEKWSAIIQDNGESREKTLRAGKSGSDPQYYRNKSIVEQQIGHKITNKEYEEKYYVEGDNKRILSGVSVLDPVLSEIVNVWFGIPGGKSFDCFAGDSVFGYVSAYTGHEFTGIELRQSQVDLNNARVEALKARYICDDGQNVAKHIEKESQDLLFSCPPYFDLEVYSDLPNDASNQKEYRDFLKILDNAFAGALSCLKQNRFAVVTVGDIRRPDGNYRRFPDHIKDIFNNHGAELYGELIMIEMIGNAAMRVGAQMKTRKPVKTHQNILIFFKGDTKQIKEIYPDLREYDNYTFKDEENGSENL